MISPEWQEPLEELDLALLEATNGDKAQLKWDLDHLANKYTGHKLNAIYTAIRKLVLA